LHLIRWAGCFVLAGLLLAALSPGPVVAEEPRPPVEVIERILAVVDDRPLFLSEVRLVEAVRGLDREAATEAAIDERLMYAEAARLPQADVTEEETSAALERLLESRPELREDRARVELRRLVRRQATIVKYVEFRFRPQVRVSPEEATEAVEDEARERAEDQTAAVRESLERRALDERIEEWVRDLRSRADVRYVRDEPGGS